MHAVTYVVPALVIGFFLWRGRRDHVYILALPLLLAYGRSIFLDIYSLRLPLGGGVTINQEDVLLVVLLLVLVYVRAVRPTASPERLTFQIYLCAGLLVLLAGKAFAADLSSWTDVASPSHLFSVAKAGAVARAWFYLPLSIMLWRVVLKRFSRQEILRLFGILIWVTAACAVVYLADLAGLSSYTRIWNPYTTQVVSGVMVHRDYLTFPAWLNVALGYSLANLAYGRQRATYLLVAVVLTGCALFSFTRSVALCAVALWFVAIFWRAVIVPLHGRSRIGRAPIGPARVLLVTSAFAAVSAAAVHRKFTLAAWWAYLGQRLSTLAPGSAGDPNTELRLGLYSRAAETISHEGFFLGTLMTSTGAAAGVYFLDSYWAQVLVSLGWFGLLVVGGLVFTALAQATARALRADAGSAILSLTILLGLLMTVLLSSTGAGWAASVAAGAFLLAIPDVRFRVAPCSSSSAGPTR